MLALYLRRLLLVDHTAGQSSLHDGLGQILHGTGREPSVERVGPVAGIAAGVDRGGDVPDGRRLVHLDDEALAVGQPDLDGRGGLRLVDGGGARRIDAAIDMAIIRCDGISLGISLSLKGTEIGIPMRVVLVYWRYTSTGR